MKTMTAVEKVRKKLAGHVHAYDIKGRTFAIQRVFFGEDNNIFFLLPGGRWTYVEGLSIDLNCHLGGVIGGYNRDAPDAVNALKHFRLITKDDAVAFLKWYEDEEEKGDRETNLVRMKELAEKLGYKVVCGKKDEEKKVVAKETDED